MPVSPGRRFEQERQPDQQPNIDGSSEKKGRKRKSKPTSSNRNRKQKLKASYAKAREDAQLAGIIPTTPEGAVRDERVDPTTQSVQPLSELVARAIRQGWSVEDGMKPHLVQEMVSIVLDPDMSAKAKVTAFNALRMADQSQWDRDHPAVNPTAKGGTGAIAISVQTNISATDLLHRMLADGKIGLGQINGTPSTTPIVARSISDSGLARQVEASAAPPDDEPEIGPGLGNAEQSDSDSVPVPTR